ncbi:MAG: endonuclease/exonuclease/phosphatase family protein [Bacteroidota bacterium]
MKNLFNLLVLILLISSCASQKHGAQKYKQGIVTPVGYSYPKKETFKILSWNVEHFLDPHDDPYINNARENNPDSTMGNKVPYMLEALREADADIVVLQEFEGAKFLRRLAQDSLPEMGYQFFADAPSHTWYMNVVVMSRFPLGILYSYGNVTTPLPNWINEEGQKESQNQINTRAWSLDVYPSEDYSFVLTALHLKAGRGERNESMRLGQINFLKGQFERFLAEDPSRNLLVVGDLNSTPNSREIQTLKKGSNDNSSFIDPMDTTVLTHTAIELTRRLDYTLPNVNMMKELVPGSTKPVYFFDPEKQDETADHLPVVIEFYRKDK